MNRAQNKAARLIQIENLLLAHPEGLTQAEIARRLKVDRSTITRYAADVPKHIYIEFDGRWKIDRTADLINVRLNLHEALAVHLASRLLATRMDRQNPHAASALRKLGVAMQRWAERISHHILESADVMDEAAQRHDPVYLRSLEQLTLAWAEQRKAQVWHFSEKTGKVHEYLFSPYFIEPYAVGQTTHVIGYSEPPSKIRTFKVERIQRVEATQQPYDIPADFDPRTLLSDAWGIWYTDNEPVEVTLKFHPRVAGRVRETRWHRSEDESELTDGSILWKARVAEPQEMLPWIRGWGADVEVLGPSSLQKELRTETRKLMRLYLNSGQEMPPYLALWAKAQKGGEEYHPLLYHLIDVGMCSQAIWSDGLSTGWRKFLVDGFGQSLKEDEIGCLFAFLAASHDLGKASPSFQARHEPSVGRIKDAGFLFPKPHGWKPAFHSTISTWILQDLLKNESGMDAKTARNFAHAIGGHHGIWPTSISIDGLSPFDKGDEKWAETRLILFEELKRLFQPPENIALPENLEQQNMILALLSGLTTAADWLGSDETFFEYDDRILTSENYAKESAENAKKALAKTGWSDHWRPTGKERTFGQAFGYLNFDAPRPIQQEVIDIAKEIEHPALLILEAPTGLGKTEVALYLADTWLQTQKGRGTYIAMPTQATSNQMFERTLDFLKFLYPDEPVNLHLAHGQAQWNDDFKALQPTSIGEGPDDIENNMRAETWFLPRKRTLLAPFGVGTVDQALMSILQSRHFFLRLFGLANKVVIFDEVHAYDTYMEKLFLRLLAWLRVLGTSVIVLSATLPEKTRREMVNAFNSTMSNEGEQVAYPRLTLATGSESNSFVLEAPKDRRVQIHWIEQSAETIMQELHDRLKDGGCVAVICNTVQRAQNLYQALQKENLVPDADLILFHSRFPPIWRKEIEEKALDKFGKNGKRPNRAIIVATQVIEQSLDLDFDLMISDLAPVDLLIQRIGRLHRHQRNGRPSSLLAPHLLIAQPEGDTTSPQFGSSGFVYAPYVLWRTWLAMNGRDEILLPGETTALIEAVYGDYHLEDFPEEFRENLEATYQKMRKEFGVADYKAESSLIPRPDTEKLVTRPMQDLKDDDDPTIHEQIKAATRLIPPDVSLVCLHKMHEGSLNTEPDGSGETIDLGRAPSKAEVQALLQRTVSVHRWHIVKALAGKTLSHWKRNAALRYSIPLIFDNGNCSIEGTSLVLKLDKKIGLQIEKETL